MVFRILADNCIGLQSGLECVIFRGCMEVKVRESGSEDRLFTSPAGKHTA